MAHSDRVDKAMRQVQPSWTPDRMAVGAIRLAARMQQRQRRRRLAAGVTACAMVATVVVAFVRWPGRDDVTVAGKQESVASDPPVLRFPDGTTAVPTRAASDLRVAEDTPARQTVKILQGGARFHVAKVKGRTFRVQLGQVVVEVLGTTFLVEQVDDNVRVSVEEGRVRVQDRGQWLELSKGERRIFPLAPLAALPQTGPEDGSAASSTAAPPQLASHGRNASSVRAVDRDPARADRVEALMVAADGARRAGNPAAALPYLREVIDRFPRDHRAPLAAFTMGILFLERLGRPTEAARAFAEVAGLDISSAALTEDALAREVEAWRKAGQPERAQRAATEYLRRYPQGRRTNSVRQFGGLH
jgi:transmembrane sensor